MKTKTFTSASQSLKAARNALVRTVAQHSTVWEGFIGALYDLTRQSHVEQMFEDESEQWPSISDHMRAPLAAEVAAAARQVHTRQVLSEEGATAVAIAIRRIASLIEPVALQLDAVHEILHFHKDWTKTPKTLDGHLEAGLDLARRGMATTTDPAARLAWQAMGAQLLSDPSAAGAFAEHFRGVALVDYL